MPVSLTDPSSCATLAPLLDEPAFRQTRDVRALSLLSGGLDSQLAICVLRDQGIDVHAVVFDSPFFDPRAAKRAAANLGVPLHVVNFAKEIIELVRDPPHGYGSCLNPCIDCHATMLRRTGEMMEREGFHFISTGEVLNQRPMSQNKQSLSLVARTSGYADYIVRPLSAQLLPETQVEHNGCVDRAGLLGLEGRGRKPQMQLATSFGLKDYPNPAGGCRLTEPNFCKRLRDLMDHEGLNGVRPIYLLRFGRHFRLAPDVKLIVGRNEKDNAVLEGAAELYDLVLRIPDIPGPTGLLPFTASDEQVREAASICARYSDAEPGESVTVRVRSTRTTREVTALAAEPGNVERLMV